MQLIEILKQSVRNWRSKVTKTYKKKIKIAIYSNNVELSEKVINKLKKEGYFKENCPTPQQFSFWGAYIPDLDLMVSHLCLEMWYPEYEENLIYGDKYLEIEQ